MSEDLTFSCFRDKISYSAIGKGIVSSREGGNDPSAPCSMELQPRTLTIQSTLLSRSNKVGEAAVIHTINAKNDVGEPVTIKVKVYGIENPTDYLPLKKSGNEIMFKKPYEVWAFIGGKNGGSQIVIGYKQARPDYTKVRKTAFKHIPQAVRSNPSNQGNGVMTYYVMSQSTAARVFAQG